MSGYIGPVPVPQGIQEKETFTATAGQTTFNTNGYTDGAFINVYLNGVRLINGTDYTATNGSDIVLTSAASASDVLDFETFNSFSLVDQTFDNVTLKNPTHEDTDGGRESAVSFKGEQSGGEISTLAQIQASHDGTSDDQKGDLIFKTNDGSDNNAPTEAARIDSGQNFLIGTTGVDPHNASSTSDVGVAVRNDGRIHVGANGQNALSVNRLTSDGEIISLKKDGTQVGGIGATGGDLTIGTGDTRVRFIDSLDCVLPVGDAAGTSRDAGVDLGHSETRFKDIYISGGIYLGAASNASPVAANYLDDYEEGTWSGTPNTSNVTGTPTMLKQTYTKIGRKVFIQLKMEATIVAANTRTFFSFVMPFSTPNNDDVFTGGGQSEATTSPFSNQSLGGADSSQGSANAMYWAFLPIQTGGHRMYLHGQFETA